MHEEAADKPNPDRWSKPVSHRQESFEDDEVFAAWSYFLPGTIAPTTPAPPQKSGK